MPGLWRRRRLYAMIPASQLPADSAQSSCAQDSYIFLLAARTAASTAHDSSELAAVDQAGTNAWDINSLHSPHLANGQKDDHLMHCSHGPCQNGKAAGHPAHAVSQVECHASDPVGMTPLRQQPEVGGSGAAAGLARPCRVRAHCGLLSER